MTRRAFPATLPPVRSLLPMAVVVSLLAGLAPGCGGDPPGSPGSTQPGSSCSQAADCGCWTCTCEGVGGAPGGAELCVDGVCPTASAACATVCDLVQAKVAAATSSNHCPAIP